jgi:hypothetical protein
MKTFKVLTLVASIFAIQMLAAQNPVISNKYSDNEITEMVKQFRSVKAHEVAPPSNLQQKFHTDFPKASDVEWETANDIYEVEFEIRFRDFKALYDKDSNLLMVVEEIRSSVLPAVVKNAAEAKYPKYKIEDIHKIRRGTETFYKVEMEKRFSDTDVKLFIKSDGTVLEERIDY